jgi:hypothetical protein
MRIDLDRFPEALSAPQVTIERAGERWACIGEVACAADDRTSYAQTITGRVVAMEITRDF